MAEEISPLEKELVQKPIEVPGSPFWDVFKRFGRDEMVAFAVNVAGTAGLEAILHHTHLLALSQAAREVALSVTGPVVEKAGFFPSHFYEAYGEYRTTPAKERGRLSAYVSRALQGGLVSLAEDVLVHDPIYISLMYAGMQLHPTTPAWILASTSFIAAIFAVAGLEVAVNEARYVALQRRFRTLGFGSEKYLESRFFVSESKKQHNLIDQVAKEFGLPHRMTGRYHDRYFATNLPQYSGRNPKLRLRKRIIESEGRVVQSAQVVYTRASEMAKNEISQFRFFPQKKEKYYFMLEQTMPHLIDDIEDEPVRTYLRGTVEDKEPRNINFMRTIATSSRDGLLVSTDCVAFKEHRPVYVVELKVYRDVKLLKEAMRYVMTEFPVMQITHTKADLAAMNSG